MDTKEFFIWLKSGLELTTLTHFDVYKSNIIKNELDIALNKEKLEPTCSSFCYWLQGVLEISDTPYIDEKQTLLIRDKINTYIPIKVKDEVKNNKDILNTVYRC